MTPYDAYRRTRQLCSDILAAIDGHLVANVQSLLHKLQSSIETERWSARTRGPTTAEDLRHAERVHGEVLACTERAALANGSAGVDLQTDDIDAARNARTTAELVLADAQNGYSEASEYPLDGVYPKDGRGGRVR